MKKIGALFLIVGLVALGFGIYGFIKVGSNGEALNLINTGVNELNKLIPELNVKISGLDFFAMNNRVWLTIAGGVAALAGAVMAFKKES